MTGAAEYAAWYAGERGAWIGSTEFAILRALIGPGANESILDVGCGTGYFTSCFAQCSDALVVGLDPNTSWLHYAERHAPSRIAWLAARAEGLPFPNASFDITVSITALCFIADQERALREIVRVTRRRFALGLLNRRSLLWRSKGRHGGTGGYRGAHWHTIGEVRALFSIRSRTCGSAQPYSSRAAAALLASSKPAYQPACRSGLFSLSSETSRVQRRAAVAPTEERWAQSVENTGSGSIEKCSRTS